jgi:hypothetical protein
VTANRKSTITVTYGGTSKSAELSVTAN